MTGRRQRVLMAAQVAAFRGSWWPRPGSCCASIPRGFVPEGGVVVAQLHTAAGPLVAGGRESRALQIVAGPRDHEREAAARALEVLELPAVLQRVAGRQIDAGRDRRLHVGGEAA